MKAIHYKKLKELPFSLKINYVEKLTLIKILIILPL